MPIKPWEKMHKSKENISEQFYLERIKNYRELCRVDDLLISKQEELIELQKEYIKRQYRVIEVLKNELFNTIKTFTTPRVCGQPAVVQSEKSEG